MLVLGIETATDVCAVALLDGERVLVEASVAVPRSHATRLAPLVAEALGHARREPRDLELITVSAGPGSYTGLRIGAATAKGLCLATGAGLAAVGTLDALAAEAAERAAGAPVLVALPSRRGEVYGALAAPEGGWLLEPAPLSLSDLEALVPAGPLAVAGPAAAAVRTALGERSVRVLDVRPSAVRVARMGAAEPTALVDPDTFEPLYLGTSVAVPAERP